MKIWRKYFGNPSPLSQQNIGSWHSHIIEIYFSMTTWGILGPENTQRSHHWKANDWTEKYWLQLYWPVMPGVLKGTRTMDCCWCLAALVSVLPMNTQILHLGSMAPLVHHFLPLITYWSPSLTIEAWMLVASEEATAGSVMAKHDRISPSSSGVSHCSWCSFVPYFIRTSMLPEENQKT